MPKKRDSDFGTWRQFAKGFCFCPAAFDGKEESDEDHAESDNEVGSDYRRRLHVHHLPAEPRWPRTGRPQMQGLCAGARALYSTAQCHHSGASEPWELGDRIAS